MDTKDKMYARFMQDMMKLSLKYPFIQKVVVSKGAYELICSHLDSVTQQEEGTVKKHIEQNPETGCIKFENIYIVPSEELK